MSNLIPALAIAVVLCTATVRLGLSCTASVRHSADAAENRELVRHLLLSSDRGPHEISETDSLPWRATVKDPGGNAWQSLFSLGVTEITFERFDPDAVVLMRSGPDMQPGVAAVDDNANGIVDDASELGATGSDDVCLVQRASPDPSDDEITLVLQHGAFVPALPSELQNRSSQWRAIVKGQSNGDHWSLLIEME
jgi:hypothetical protein